MLARLEGQIYLTSKLGEQPELDTLFDMGVPLRHFAATKLAVVSETHNEKGGVNHYEGK